MTIEEALAWADKHGSFVAKILAAALRECREESEWRRNTLFQKSAELKAEWCRAEKAEAEVAMLKALFEQEQGFCKVMPEDKAEIVRLRAKVKELEEWLMNEKNKHRAAHLNGWHMEMNLDCPLCNPVHQITPELKGKLGE